MILCLVGTVPVNAEASMEEIYDKELETAIISGTGTEDDPYVLDYSKAPMFTEYMVETYESYKQPLTRGSFTSNSLTKYYGVVSKGGRWGYTSGGLSVSSDGNLRIVTVAYTPNSKLNALYAGTLCPDWLSIVNDVVKEGNNNSNAIKGAIVTEFYNRGYTAYAGYSTVAIGDAVAAAVGATRVITGVVVLACAIQSSIVKSARDSGLN